MTSEYSDGRIRFSWTVHFQTVSTGPIFLDNNYKESAKFACAFSDNSSTGGSSYSVSTTSDTDTIEQDVQWDNFKLSFSRNGAFDGQSDDSFSVGDTIYLQIQWDHGVLDDGFPVRFFVDSCRVSENSKGPLFKFNYKLNLIVN